MKLTVNLSPNLKIQMYIELLPRNRLAGIVRALETAAARHPEDEVVRAHLSSCGLRLARLDAFIDDPAAFENTAGTPRFNGI